VKDGINNAIVHGRKEAVNPDRRGTKVSADYQVTVGAGESKVVRLRLTDKPPQGDPFTQIFDKAISARISEADEFFASVIPAALSEDSKRVMRQAVAGMLWSKQLFYYDVDKWLEEHGDDPFKRPVITPRAMGSGITYNRDIISMPDKWNTRGLRPGTWPSTYSHSPWWMRTLARSS
jgi:hypothetical protein